MDAKDIPCSCGHKKSEHKSNFDGSPKIVCKKKKSKEFFSGWADDCMQYTQDNLLYIERLAKKRKLI